MGKKRTLKKNVRVKDAIRIHHPQVMGDAYLPTKTEMPINSTTESLLKMKIGTIILFEADWNKNTLQFNNVRNIRTFS